MATQGLGIDRAHYMSLRTPDPAAAAAFAERHMGMTLVHTDDAGRHYLAAHGLDAYSLMYTPGEDGVDHVSYLVSGADALAGAEEHLAAAGVESQRLEPGELWRHGPAVRFQAPSGTTLELTTGVTTDVPMHWKVTKPVAPVAPITFDHTILRAADVEGMIRFATEVMGLKESGRIVKPDGVPFLTFFRSHTIFHCLGIASSEYDGLHHYQYTLKNGHAVFEAAERLRQEADVNVLWGPIRHGCGQNITFYFHDHAGNIVEYSAEEEVILDDATYVPLTWPITDIRATNEWGDDLPPAAMK